MPEPEKLVKDRARQEEPQLAKKTLFSSKGLIILIAALALEAIAAGVLMSTVARGQSNKDDQQKVEPFPLQLKRHVTLDGPTFAVQETDNTFHTVQIRTIVVELDSQLDTASLDNLEANLKDLNYEIKDALQNIVISDGYRNILLPRDRQRLQSKLRQEIIRLMGGNVTEKEIKAVIFDTFQIGD
jgi:flagellar basal body-associated protein FliL